MFLRFSDEQTLHIFVMQIRLNCICSLVSSEKVAPSGDWGTRAQRQSSITFTLVNAKYIFVTSLPSHAHVAGDLYQEMSFVVRRSLDFVRSRFTRAHPLEPELPSAIKYFFKI